jgi:hypothetical protein
MKNLSVILMAVALLGASCKKDSSSSSTNSLGGSTNVPLNTVGNQFAGIVKINGATYSANESMQIATVTDGITTVNCTATVPSTSPLFDLIPSSYMDNTGHLSGNLKFKITSEGIMDYTNADGAPHVLVKYDASVGDKYIVEKSNGSKITRTVTAKSTTDDYGWGGMLIKTVTVEQDSRIPGVSKIIYQANHHFGLVSVKAVMDDNSTTEVVLTPAIY